MTARAKSSSIVLPPDYRPSEDEPFMNERQRMYFRQKLVAWKDEIIRQTRETLVGLHEELTQHADLADRATSETDRALELRARDRQRKLVAKIDAALARIEDGSYGYCEETGEPIGLKRLDARPIATLVGRGAGAPRAARARLPRGLSARLRPALLATDQSLSGLRGGARRVVVAARLRTAGALLGQLHHERAQPFEVAQAHLPLRAGDG